MEAGRLEELRLGATEDRIEADLALGRHADVTGELEALVAVHPLRERLHGQLMLALYRGGRQAEALGAYRAARQILVRELGLEPGPALQRLEAAILRQDPALDPSETAAPPDRDPAPPDRDLRTAGLGKARAARAARPGRVPAGRGWPPSRRPGRWSWPPAFSSASAAPPRARPPWRARAVWSP